MKRTLITLLAVGTLAMAGSASAQLVNGLPGPNYHGDAPIGTKGGGAPSTLNIPGEKEAIAGAEQNAMEAKHMGPLPRPVGTRVTVAVKTSVKPQPQTVARNEFTSARTRLDNNSD